jgi:hypothetical protein
VAAFERCRRLRAEQCPHGVGLDDRGNRVDPDAARREFDREVAHQAFREAFATPTAA